VGLTHSRTGVAPMARSVERSENSAQMGPCRRISTVRYRATWIAARGRRSPEGTRAFSKGAPFRALSPRRTPWAAVRGRRESEVAAQGAGRPLTAGQPGRAGVDEGGAPRWRLGRDGGGRGCSRLSDSGASPGARFSAYMLLVSPAAVKWSGRLVCLRSPLGRGADPPLSVEAVGPTRTTATAAQHHRNCWSISSPMAVRDAHRLRGNGRISRNLTTFVTQQRNTTATAGRSPRRSLCARGTVLARTAAFPAISPLS
jgi:hypothetical protein